MGCACARPRGQVPEIQYQMNEILVKLQGDALVDGCQITISSEGSSYVSTHIYPDFVSLEDKIKTALTGKPWVDCELPKVKRVLSKDFKDETAFNKAKFNACETFVKHIVDNPCLLIDQVVEFLNIGEPHKGAIKKYQADLKKHGSADSTK